MASGLTLDSGALIAAEKGERRAWLLVKRASDRGATVTVPAPVLAQVWRGGNANVARMLKGCVIESMDETRAKLVGLALGKSDTKDLVDALVVLGAVSRGDAVLTSDPDDLRHIAAALGKAVNLLTV